MKMMIRKSKVILPINNLNYGVTLPSLSQRNWVRRRGALSCVGSRDSYRNTLPAVKLCSPNCSQHEHQNSLFSFAKLEYCLQCIITDNGPVPPTTAASILRKTSGLGLLEETECWHLWTLSPQRLYNKIRMEFKVEKLY